MESVLAVNALQFAARLCLPILGAILGGAVIAGVLRVSTQIEDTSINLVAKIAAVGLLFSFTGSQLAQQMFDFALRLWSGADFYH